jgi:hypothetical protein
MAHAGGACDRTRCRMYDVGGQRNERRKWIHHFDDVQAIIYVAAINEYDLSCFEEDTQNRLVEALNVFDDICNSTWFESKSIILFLNKRDLFERKIRVKDIRQEEKGLFLDYTRTLRHDTSRHPAVLHCFTRRRHLPLPRPRRTERNNCCCCRGARHRCSGIDWPARVHLRRGRSREAVHPQLVPVSPQARLGKEGRPAVRRVGGQPMTAASQIYHHITCATDTSNIKHVFNATKDIILRGVMEGSSFM